MLKFDGSQSGFFERTTDENWEPFVPFASNLNVRWDDPNLRFVDLTGDGHADILITEQEIFTWYPSKAEKGFAEAEEYHKHLMKRKDQGSFLEMVLNLYIWPTYRVTDYLIWCVYETARYVIGQTLVTEDLVQRLRWIMPLCSIYQTNSITGAFA